MWRFLFLALGLAGCGSTGIVPTGSDTYMVAKTSAACGFRSSSGTEATLHKQAHAFCSDRGDVAETVSVEGRDGVPFARCASAELHFRCVDR